MRRSQSTRSRVSSAAHSPTASTGLRGTPPGSQRTSRLSSQVSSQVSSQRTSRLSSRSSNRRGSPPNRRGSPLWTANGGVPLYMIMNHDEIKDPRGNKNSRGRPIVHRVPKYHQFNKNGRWIIDPRYPRPLTAQEKADYAVPAPPPLCLNQPLNLRDSSPSSCFVAGMRERLDPVLKKIEAGKASGVDACAASDTGALQPHQQGIFELARALSVKRPDQVNGFRGMLVWHNTGSGKCVDVNTDVLMHDGSVVKAGALQTGMRLMGQDGTPRVVLDVGRGRETMYEIAPAKGEPWRCNASHVLSLKFVNHGKIRASAHGTYNVWWHESIPSDDPTVVGGKVASKAFKTLREAEAFVESLGDVEGHVVDISLQEYLALPESVKHQLKLFRTGPLDFSTTTEPKWDPYVIGAWLGDGCSRSPSFALGDVEVVCEIERRSPGLRMVPKKVGDGRRDEYYLRCDDDRKGKTNPFRNALRDYSLLEKKHIPDDIKRGSRQARLEVLAGILDTDGYLGGNTYEIIQKNETLARDIVFVARSLGFAAYVKPCVRNCHHPDGRKNPGTYHRVSISGEGLDAIPVVLTRKKASARGQLKNGRHVGFTVTEVGEGEYAGPVLDGDHRYVLGCFTVTHNTLSALGLALAFWNTGRNIMLVTTPANEADNNLKKYAQNLFVFFPSYASKVFAGKQLPPKPWTLQSPAVKQWCNSLDNISGLVRKIRTFTFTTFASQLGFKGSGFGVHNPMGPEKLLANGGKGSVVIMDEVQSLFTPDPRFREATEPIVRTMTRPDIAKNMYVFALTATPGNTVADMIKVLNFVKPVNHRPFTPADAANPALFRGLVSYVDIRSDTTRYGTKTVQNLYVPLGHKYYAAYLKGTTLNEADLDFSKYEKASKSMAFLLKQRTAGNFLIKSAASGIYTEADLRELAAKKPIPYVVRINANQMRLLSDKLILMLENVLKMPGKQYVWVAELNTAKVVAAALRAIGYAQVEPKDFVGGKDARGRPVFKEGPRLAAAGRRFIMYKKGTANGEQLDDSILKAFADYYNNRANDGGSVCKIMLATETYYQGLDMRALQGVHLVDTLFNAAADKQAVGRALRLCGHSGAPTKRVVVHRYFAVPPPKFSLENIEVKGAAKKILEGKAKLDKFLRSIPARSMWGGVPMPEGTRADNVGRYSGVNAYVFADAARRHRPVDQFELGLKAFAVDCPLFKNTYHRQEPFQCGAVPSPAAASVSAPAAPGILVASRTNLQRQPNRRPTTPNRRPTTPNRRPTTPNRRPATPNRRPATPNRRPATPNRRPTTPNRRPATPNRRPAIPNRRLGQLPGQLATRRPSVVVPTYITRPKRSLWSRLFGTAPRNTQQYTKYLNDHLAAVHRYQAKRRAAMQGKR